MKRSTHYLLAALLAGLFGLFLTYGSLTSSDFPRGTFGCPYSDVDSHWTGYAELNANLAYHVRGAWGASYTLSEFLQNLGSHGVGVALGKGWWNLEDSTSDSIPYLVNYYSAGQYDILQADWNQSFASLHLLDEGETYSYFEHDPGTYLEGEIPGAEMVVACPKDSCTNQWGQGWFLKGCKGTISHAGAWEPFMNVGSFDYKTHGGRTFISRFRAAIDSSQGVGNNEIVLIYDMPYFKANGDTLSHHYRYVTKGEFGGDQNFQEFQVEGFADTSYRRLEYRFYTTNLCDIYVDWVEYMDKDAQLAIAKLKGQGVDQQRQEAAYAAER